MKIIKEPIYQQLIKILRTRIQSSEYKIGDKFLSENEISILYEISKNTVNKAITSLIGEGLLEFRKGLGTFIRLKHSQYDLHSLISFTKMAESTGTIPSTRVVEFKKITCSETDNPVRAALELDEHSQLYYMKRLRLLSGKPSIIEVRYVDAALCPELKKSDVTKSIITMWMDKYNLNLASADQTLRAVLLNDENALLLEQTVGDPAIERESTGFIEGNRPLWFERTIFCGKDYVFKFRIESLNAAHTAKSVFVGNRENI